MALIRESRDMRIESVWLYVNISCDCNNKLAVVRIIFYCKKSSEYKNIRAMIQQ